MSIKEEIANLASDLTKKVTKEKETDALANLNYLLAKIENAKKEDAIVQAKLAKSKEAFRQFEQDSSDEKGQIQKQISEIMGQARDERGKAKEEREAAQREKQLLEQEKSNVIGLREEYNKKLQDLNVKLEKIRRLLEELK